MNKKSAIEAVKTVVTGITMKDAEKAVNTTLQAVANALARGEEVQLSGFGVFKVVDVAERQGYNPSTGGTITIPAHKAVRFKAYKDLLEKVK